MPQRFLTAYPFFTLQIAIYAATKRAKNLPKSRTAGLDLISSDIGSHVRTLQDVKAGSSILDSLERETHRQVS